MAVDRPIRVKFLQSWFEASLLTFSLFSFFFYLLDCLPRNIESSSLDVNTRFKTKIFFYCFAYLIKLILFFLVLRFCYNKLANFVL